MHLNYSFSLSSTASYLLVKCPESRYSPVQFTASSDLKLFSFINDIRALKLVSCSYRIQNFPVARSSGETVTSSSSSSNSSPRAQRKDTRRKSDRRPTVKPPEPPEEPPPHIPVKGKAILRGQAATLVKFFGPFQCLTTPPPHTHTTRKK